MAPQSLSPGLPAPRRPRGRGLGALRRWAAVFVLVGMSGMSGMTGMTGMTGGVVAAAPRGTRPADASEPYFVRGRYAAAASRFRVGDWSGAIDGFSAALAAAPASHETRRARHLLGLALANAGRWSEAASTFVGLWKESDLLADHVAYQSARALLRAGDAEAALTWSAKVDEASVLAAEAALIGLDALGGLGRNAELASAAGRFLERHPAGPRRHEAHLAQGMALRALGRPLEAARAYRQAWAHAPGDAFAKRADDQLAAVMEDREAAPAPQADVLRDAARKRASEWLTRAILLAERNRHEAAEAAFVAALSAPDLDATTACRARFGAGNAVFRLRQRARALHLFEAAEKSCGEAGDDDYVARALYQRGRCLVLTGDLAGAAAAFDRLETRFPTHRLADDARMRGAEVAVDRGDLKQADALLSTLASRYPGGDMAAEAQWRLAFRAHQRGDHETARRLLQPAAAAPAVEPVAATAEPEGEVAGEVATADTSGADRARSFEARSWEGTGNQAEAIRVYEQTVRTYPLSLHALWALERLGELAPLKQKALLDELRASKVPVPADAPEVLDPGEARALELARMGLGGEAQRELARALRRLKDLTPARVALVAATVAETLDHGGFWAVSHGLAVGRLREELRRYPRRAGRSRAADAWRLAYPRAFAEVVLASSARNGVPAALQWALMRQESRFEPRAESSANCFGLTMLKPSTAEQRLGRPVTREELFDPATNLSAGSKHLAALLRRYRGAVIPAVAAYNAGETAVGRWLAERGDLA
ncbi:MAG TPA: transglycosylase SLT domain-containing protein, partial [Polyangia bacterium]